MTRSTSLTQHLDRRPPTTCPPDAPVSQVARQLGENEAEAVVVIDADRRPIGIITNRDIVRRAVARGLSPETSAREIMSDDVATIRADGDAADAARQMADRECRRLPVVDDAGRLAGIVEFDDIFEHVQDSLEALALVIRHQHHPSSLRIHSD